MAKNDPIRKYQQMSGNNVVSVAATSTTTTATGNADTVDGFHASATAIGNTLLALDSDGYLPTSITGDADTVDAYQASELAVLAEAETVTGLWTFSRSTNAPFACVAGAAKVTYLDADKLDGYEGTAFPRKSEAATIGGGWTFQADIQADCNLDFVGAQSITTTTGDLTINPAGDVQMDADLDFVGAQSITTTAGDLTIAPAGGLAVDADLNFTGAQSITTTAGDLTIAPTGDVVFNPTGNDILPTTNYDLNIGSLAKKYLTLHAAELWVETLVAQDTIATIGGRILVGPTTTLTSDLASGDTTIYVKHNEMASGDRVYMEANGQLEWMAVTSAASGSGPYSYTVTRDLDGTGANNWYAGDAVFNTGAANDGFIDLYSLQGIHGSGAGPTIVGWVRQSDTYNDIEERWAIGNLNGLYGISDNYYGVGIGDPDGDRLLYDTNGGLQVYAGAQHVLIDSDGINVGVETSVGSSSSINFVNSLATKGIVTRLGSYSNSGTSNAGASLTLTGPASYTSTMTIDSTAAASEDAHIYITASTVSGNQAQLHIYSDYAHAPYIESDCDVRIATGLYVGATDTAPTPDCIHLDGNLVGTTLYSFSDDSARSFTPANAYGAVLVMGRAGSYDHLSALVVYRTVATPATYLLAGGSSVAVTTGGLDGTTGTDGKFTISAHTDGKIYFENRIGQAVSVHYICFGA